MRLHDHSETVEHTHRQHAPAFGGFALYRGDTGAATSVLDTRCAATTERKETEAVASASTAGLDMLAARVDGVVVVAEEEREEGDPACTVARWRIFSRCRSCARNSLLSIIFSSRRTLQTNDATRRLWAELRGVRRQSGDPERQAAEDSGRRKEPQHPHHPSHHTTHSQHSGA